MRRFQFDRAKSHRNYAPRTQGVDTRHYRNFALYLRPRGKGFIDSMPGLGSCEADCAHCGLVYGLLVDRSCGFALGEPASSDRCCCAYPTVCCARKGAGSVQKGRSRFETKLRAALLSEAMETVETTEDIKTWFNSILQKRARRQLPDALRDVLQRVANGGTAPSIAADKGRSIRTIAKQYELILAKLEAKTMHHAVAIGIRRGIIK